MRAAAPWWKPGRRRPGGVGLTALLALIPITLILLASLNTGQAGHERRLHQDTADAMVLAHQDWAARSLNVIAMNQVAITQLTSVAIGAEALDGSLNILTLYSSGAILYITGHGLARCPGFVNPWVIAYCGLQHLAQTREAVSALSYVSRTRDRYRPEDVIRTSQDGLQALGEINAEIIARFPRAMQDMARSYADHAGLEDWYYLEGCQGEDIRACENRPVRGGRALPLHDGGAGGMFELCQALRLGTANGRTGFQARGFPLLKGPLTYGGSEAQPDLMKHINAESEIGERLESFYDFYDVSELMTPPGARLVKRKKWKRALEGILDWANRLISIALYEPFPDYLNLPFEQEKDGPNVFTVLFLTKVADVCANDMIPDVPFLSIGLQTDLPPIWMANDIGPVARVLLKRPEEMPEDFKTLVAVVAQSGRRFGASHFLTPPDRAFAYAQAGLTAESSADLFSAAWRASLMGASRLDEPGPAARDIRDHGPAALAGFAELLRAVDGSEGWETINAH